VLRAGAGFESWDAALGNTGLAFASASSLMPGQIVSVRAVAAPAGPPFLVSADRVRLRSVTLTARVAAVQSEAEFLLSELPPHVAAPRILVRHGSRASIAAGDLVSVAGYLLAADPQPVLLAERLLAR
jgi:hypothetical protein